MNRKYNSLITAIAIVVFYCLWVPNASFAQTNSPGEPHDSKLYKTIVHMDSVLFDAFNNHDLATLGSQFDKNVEFFHDKGGLSDYAATMNSFKNVAQQSPDLRRELVAGTLEVYPVPGYGAIEMGEHRFIHKENGKELIGVFKFVHIWQYKDGVWKITRVVSVGH